VSAQSLTPPPTQFWSLRGYATVSHLLDWYWQK